MNYPILLSNNPVMEIAQLPVSYRRKLDTENLNNLLRDNSCSTPE
jgi:hypothetical protein